MASMESRYAVAHVHEIQPAAAPEPGAAEWRPVRRHFGIHAFGVNAWTGRNAGDEVIEPHDEAADGHEELYLVLRGHATFEIAGEHVDAPPGTLVYVAPGTFRVAHAKEPLTAVLAIGARPGVAFEVSEWERRDLG